MRLNVVCYVNGSGYGVVGFNLVKALDSVGCRVALFPIASNYFQDLKPDLDDVMMLRRCTKNQEHFDWTAPCLRISPQHDLSLFAGKALRCGLSFYETDRFTARAHHHLSALDLLFTPSRWAQEVALANDLRGVRVRSLPMGVDSDLFCPGSRQEPEPGPTTFLHVGKWEYRKGQDILVRAFDAAFKPQDNVRLLLMCDNPCLRAGKAFWQELLGQSSLRDKIEVVPRLPEVRQLVDYMRRADCGVFPYRSEGWNLPLLEMMACGKSVIATLYSGPTEYLTGTNCKGIEVESLEKAVDPHYQYDYGTGQWAHLGSGQVEQLISHLRDVHARKQAGLSLFNSEGVDTARRFSWRGTARQLLQELELTSPPPPSSLPAEPGQPKPESDAGAGVARASAGTSAS